MGLAREGQEGHVVEHLAQLRILLHLPGHHVRHLGDAGDEHLHVVLLLVLGVLPVVLHGAAHAGLLEQLFHVLGVLAGDLRDLGEGLGLTLAHLEHDLSRLVGGHRAVQNDVLRVVLGDLLDAEFLRNSVGDHFTELKQNLSCHVVLVPFP